MKIKIIEKTVRSDRPFYFSYIPGFYLGFFVLGGVDSEKKFLSLAAAKKNFFGLVGGSGGMLSRKILKI